MNRHKYEGAFLALLALIGSSATAMAQDAAPAAQPAAAPAAQPAVEPAPATASGSLGLGMSAGTTTTPVLDADANARANAANNPASAAAAPATVEPPPLPPPPVDPSNQTDHERVVGAYGVGLLGVASLDNLDYGVINAPILGVRHWVSDAWGIQAGLGVAHQSGTASNNIVGAHNVEDPTYWGFAAHVGVPLALYHDKHYTFLFLPEANFGYSTWRQKDDKNSPAIDDGTSGRAWLLDVGARAGAEIHFGFMGMPMLTLQGTVGAHMTYRDSGVKSFDASGNKVERGQYTFGLTTAKYNDPWDIFVSSISALYYFK
jgi:hypothetical protein